MDFQTIIIGFGKGGKTLAAKLAAKGEKVALIERNPEMYGGTCINVGCLPTKRLVMLAEKAPKGDYAAQNAWFQEALRGKDTMTAALRKANYQKLIQAGVQVLDGIGSFEDAHHVRVEKPEGESTVISGEKIIINTGSAPFIPEIPGLRESSRTYISETMLNIPELPKRLTIIGGGYIGLEFASIFTGFGSKVTILQDSDVFLPREDRDVAEAILQVLNNRGAELITGAVTTEIQDGTVVYRKGGETLRLEGDAILVATGRRPNTRELHVEKAGVELTARGGIAVNEHNRTTAENIWAAGDVIGGLQFTYISLDDSRIILSDMAGSGERTTGSRGAFAYSVFMDPPYARAGLNEEEAKAKGLNYRIAKLPTAAIPKAKVLMKDAGLLKAVIDRDTGRILGAELFCAESFELINMIKLAMDQGLDYTVLRDFIYTHPTMAEAFNDLFAL